MGRALGESNVAQFARGRLGYIQDVLDGLGYIDHAEVVTVVAGLDMRARIEIEGKLNAHRKVPEFLRIR